LEGVAIGIGPSAEQVLMLAGAVACHKFVVAFCYGLELRASGRGCLGVFGHIFLLSLGSMLGIILGGLLAENEHFHIQSGPAVPIIQVCEFSDFSMWNGTRI
jgi:zinc transporter 1/2/3